MASFRTLMKEILNVNDIVIQNCFIGKEMNGDTYLEIQSRWRKSHVHVCPFCGRPASGYDTRPGCSRFRAPDIHGIKVYLTIQLKRVHCNHCKCVWVEGVPWVHMGTSFTHDFDYNVAWLATHVNKSAASEYFRISWRTVGECISRTHQDLEPDPSVRFKDLRFIGIDETSFARGRKYIIVIVNHETGELIWANEGHDEATLNRFFEQLTPEQRTNIQGVSADGARWIDASLQKYCPNAVRCIDRFHVIQWANDTLDKIRVEAWRKSRIELAQLQKKYDITSKKLNDLKALLTNVWVTRVASIIRNPLLLA